MKYKRSDTPAYLIWVERRPTNNGKGKKAYYDAVRQAAQAEIDSPITTDDIEIEIIYTTDIKKAERKDVDNVNKPTLDALEGVAYQNDHQVRSVSCTLFDKNRPATVSGHVEQMNRLFYSDKPHVILIMIYSDTRLAELGGEGEVQRCRYIEWQHNFDMMLSERKKLSAAK